jgi:hypothetical protein
MLEFGVRLIDICNQAGLKRAYLNHESRVDVDRNNTPVAEIVFLGENFNQSNIYMQQWSINITVSNANSQNNINKLIYDVDVYAQAILGLVPAKEAKYTGAKIISLTESSFLCLALFFEKRRSVNC